MSAADSGWMADALCAETDPDAFHPERANPDGAARRVCQRCDVQAACLAYALATGQSEGVWGGTSPAQRRRMRLAKVVHR
ncbi:WhiB family transcriptional regulator [Actinokineospora diospyrosa]